MNHPLFKQPVMLIWYVLFWLVLGVVQFFTEIQVMEANMTVATVDAIISYTIFALLGLGIWYVVQTNDFGKSSTQIAIYHLFSMALMISFWIWSSSQILQIIFHGKETLVFTMRLIPWKLVLGVLIYILITAFYYTIYYSARLKEKMEEERRLRELVTETQLNELKSQINPHFLFNSLNSVSYLTIAEPEKAQEMVIKLSNFLRYSLKHKENMLVSLHQEIDHIKLYLDIEKVRFGDKLNALFDLEDCEDCLIPNMILQPLYENAIKYGVYETTSQVTINTKILKSNGTLIIGISNNYDPDAVAKKGEGIGLHNIRKRLGLVYGDSTLLKISNENNIFQATLTIPQKK